MDIKNIIPKRFEAYLHLDEGTDCQFRYVKNDTEKFSLHCHEYYEIFLMTKGKAYHTVNGKTSIIEEGALIFIRKDDAHLYNYAEGPFEFINLAFSESTIMELFDYLGDGFPSHSLLSAKYAPEVFLTKNEVKKLYMKMAEINTVSFSDSKRLKFKIRKLLSEIFSNYFDISPEDDSDIPFWLENACRKMRDPKNFIEGKEKLFELAGKSKEHTARSMKKYYNQTPTEYVNELRLSYAANLLISSNYNIIDICYECGFQNVSWFINEFTRCFGTTPKQFKMQKKNDVSDRIV